MAYIRALQLSQNAASGRCSRGTKSSFGAPRNSSEPGSGATLPVDAAVPERANTGERDRNDGGARKTTTELCGAEIVNTLHQRSLGVGLLFGVVSLIVAILPATARAVLSIPIFSASWRGSA